VNILSGQVGSFSVEWTDWPRLREGCVDGLSWKVSGRALTVCIGTERFVLDIETVSTDEGDRYTLRRRFRSGFWPKQRWVREFERVLSDATSGVKRIARVKAQMPGKVVRLHVEAGAAVKKGDPLLVLEAMKMENEIRAPNAGVIDFIGVQVGQTIESGHELLRLVPLAAEQA